MGLIVLRLLLSPLAQGWFLDVPNHRSLHRSPIPRTGGIAIVLGVLASLIWLPGFHVMTVCLAMLGAISLLDDWRGLHQGLRLSVHLLVALAFLVLSWRDSNPLVVLLAVLAVGWMTNLYNFMDGSDGLAGGMAVLGFGFYALAAWIGESSQFATVCLCIAAAVLPFLVLNFSPSRIFLGDAGSIPLGFLAGALGVQGWLQGEWSLWFPILVFSPFIVDASMTLARRVMRGERFWQPHRDHYYQRLIRLGWSHRRTAFSAYLVMMFTGLLGLLTLMETPWMTGLALLSAVVLYTLLARMIDQAWERRLAMDDA